MKCIVGCAAALYTRTCKCFLLRFALLLINISLSTFDCYTDFKVWKTVEDKGFQHPFLQLPSSWAKAWLAFTILGTITAVFVILNEISLLLDLCNVDVCCILCKACGCNYVTRSEALTLINIIVEDLPLLILTILFAASRYSCNHPTPPNSSSVLRAVLLSSLASVGAVGWTFLRGMFRILIRCYRKRDSRSENKEKLDANELYPKGEIMGCCMACHTVFMLLFHIVTLILSIGTVIIAGILLSHGAFGNSLDPSKELNVYLSYPNDKDHHLTNTSALLQRGSEGLCYNVKINHVECSLILRYDPDDHQLEFNSVPIAGSTQVSDSNRATDIDVFLGHVTPTGSVEKFEKTCLAVMLIPENKGNVRRNGNLQIPC